MDYQFAIYNDLEQIRIKCEQLLIQTQFIVHWNFDESVDRLCIMWLPVLFYLIWTQDT